MYGGKYGYGFHSTSGLFFQRGAEGNVIIRKVDKDKVLFEVSLDQNTWGSAVASVCARGENAQTFHEAVVFHNAKLQ